MNYTVIGGDLRNKYIYELLKNEAQVKITGFNNIEEIPNTENLQKALNDSRIIIGPTPSYKDYETLNCPFNDEPILFEEVFNTMDENQIFIAGRIPEDLLNKAKEKNILCFDILEREEMALLNAIPTAEGAIQIAFENMETTLLGSEVLVLGFGRIGKLLAKMLYGIGAKVCIASKFSDELALAKGFGYKTLKLDNLSEILNKFDLIINTIPKIVLNDSNLKYVKNDCLLIELASKPFGIDSDVCRNKELNLIFAPSLPGKVAPLSAAQYIIETIKIIEFEYLTF